MMNSDSTAIDRIVSTFYASFASPRHGFVDLTELRGLFHDGAGIVKVADGAPVVYSVESFIAPREELLNSGRLLPYSGWGRKSIQLVRSPDGWRISAISWCDSAEGLPIPS